MSKKSNRTKRSQQARLKLEGQKLCVIDNLGGRLSSWGGLLPVAHIARQSGLLRMFTEIISEWRMEKKVKHKKWRLLFQRLLLAACGFADAIDCSFWKNDPALKAALSEAIDGPALGSQSTHTRMEQHVTAATIKNLEQLPREFFFQQHKHAPQNLTVYFDGVAIRTFGAQQNSTYRGGKKYSQNQFFPLQASTDSGELLLAQLRKGGSADAHALPAIQNLLLEIKARWPSTAINLVVDTGFNSPELLDLLEAEKIDYACGYPATSSVQSKIPDVLKQVEAKFRELHGEPKYIGPTKPLADERWQAEHDRIRALPKKERMKAEKEQAGRIVRNVFDIMHNGTRWGKERRLIVRVDYTDRGHDIRCVVTNKMNGLPECIYEDEYCRRARIEMFIKENKSHSKVPLSAQEFTANQFRFGLQGLVYMLLHLVRKQLPVKQQNCSITTIRNKLLLIPVLIESTERRIQWHLSSIHPSTQTVINLANKLQQSA